MRALGLTAAAGMALGLTTAPVAAADIDFALNGSYHVVSNGEWAKTNEVFMDEHVVDSVWTFSTTCANAHQCTGSVSSDKGWTAPVEFRTTRWIVDRVLPGWEPCVDGTAATGRQRFQFFGVNVNGQNDKRNTQTLAGYERTIGDPGGCGRNQPLVIQMPVTLTRL